MGRTALYRELVSDPLPRAEVQLEPNVLVLAMPGGGTRRHALDGCAATTSDGFVAVRGRDARWQRRFVRMLMLDRDGDRDAVITPPDVGAVAPNVVRVPEAPSDAAIVDARAWEALADWLVVGGRLAACSIADLARLATIATPAFAALIGEVAAERALELAALAGGPLRGGAEVDSGLQPLVEAARTSTTAGEALTSALAHAAGARRRRRR